MSLALAATLVVSMVPGQTATVANAASNYNYAEALQKANMFYEFQRSGDLTNERNNWRGDSGLKDGSDVGLDLTGGLYDAGDHVKFNLPMAYTATMLAWSVYESKDALVASGQLDYQLANIKWITDYLIKCHPSPNVYYYQVGDGNADHAWWGPAEVMQMKRPSYSVTTASPGSAVVGEAAAALASAAIVFADIDPSYAATCLSHAKDLYNFAETTKSDAGYTAASGFYNSWSGFYDELSWAGVWLYMATDNETYLNKAESYVANWGTEGQSTDLPYKWALNWDDVHSGASLLLARITNKAIYKTNTENHLDYWTTGVNGSKITYSPKGLAYCDTWGSLRYATTTAFLASVYADWTGCPTSKVATYNNFAKAQVDYALGSTGRSFVVGFGVNPPEHPHHRTAHSSWADSQSVPSYHRHTLVGALVGGPSSSDSYTDAISDYTANEVACDYNAGFVGVLAKLYEDFGGTPIANLTAYETPSNDEFFVEAGTNATSSNFLEVKMFMYNESGWPARVGDKLSTRYFVDITEGVNAGYTASDYKITTNYNGGAKVTGLLPWDAANNIYYVNIDFTGTNIYPGGQSAYRKEVQFRVAAPTGVAFDNSNDFSYKDIKGVSSGSIVKTKYMPVYDAGVLVYGLEPGGSTIPTTTPTTKPTATPTATPTTTPTTTPTATPTQVPTATPTTKPTATPTPIVTEGAVPAVTVTTTNNENSVNQKYTVTAVGGTIDLSKLSIVFTADGMSTAAQNVFIDNAALQINVAPYYSNLNSAVAGTFSNGALTISVNSDAQLAEGTGYFGIELRFAKADWSPYGPLSNEVVKVYYDGVQVQ